MNYTEAFTHERVFSAYKKINRIEDTRENELGDINQFAKALIDKVEDVRKLSGYLLSKSVIVSSTEEFDLLRFSKKSILNIEIKAMSINQEENLKQLVRHEYLLNCIPGKRKVTLFTYVVSEKLLYRLENHRLVMSNIEELVQNIALDYLKKDLLKNLSTEDFIISPYATIEKFYNSHYFLNSEQSKFINEQVVDYSNEKVLLQGGPGTVNH